MVAATGFSALLAIHRRGSWAAWQCQKTRNISKKRLDKRLSMGRAGVLQNHHKA
jgi:hypothetical protein